MSPIGSPSRSRRLGSIAAAVALVLLVSCGDDRESASGAEQQSPATNVTAAAPTTASPVPPSAPPTVPTTAPATAPPTTEPPGTSEPTTTEPPTSEPAPADDPVRVVDVVADDFSFEIVSGERVAQGIVPVTMRNDGAEMHQLMVVRLHDGVALDQYLELAQTDEGGAGELIDNAGGINAIDAGETATGYADFSEPGTYVFLCYLPSTDGVGHLHKGMVQTVEVVETDDPVPAPEPVDDVTLIDFNFILPDRGLGTKGTYRFVNGGEEAHEMAILRINEGKELGDVVTYLQSGFQGESPLTFESGLGGVDPGKTGYVDLDLGPGQYIAICFVSSPETHQHHAEMGMFLPFTVA